MTNNKQTAKQNINDLNVDVDMIIDPNNPILPPITRFNSITVAKAEKIIKDNFKEEDRIFSSHQFIRKYRKAYEREYIMTLYAAINNKKNNSITKGGNGFRVVNAFISSFLARNAKTLNIKKIEGTYLDETDFDNNCPNALWRRTPKATTVNTNPTPHPVKPETSII